jgi:hypothetical protein
MDDSTKNVPTLGNEETSSIITSDTEIIATTAVVLQSIEVQLPNSSTPKFVNEIATPLGFTRLVFPKDSFPEFLQNLPLKENLEILKFDNNFVKSTHYNRLAVIKMPLLFQRDLEQCADWTMRFHAEYYQTQQKLDNLYLFNYSGKKRWFKNQNKSFKDFLQTAFASSNSHSLKMGCQTIEESEFQPGDLFVQNRNGGIGHVSMAVDACSNEHGEKLYLIGFSFMPAQEFHIEAATWSMGRDGWFTIKGFINFLERYFPYGEPMLKRF